MGIFYVSPFEAHELEPAPDVAIPAFAHPGQALSPPPDAPEPEPVVSPRKRGARVVARVDVPAGSE